MGWSIGYDDNLQRDIGYGVPAYCDHPDCKKVIDRGLAHRCGEGGDLSDEGCGMHFCADHLSHCYVDHEEDESESCRGQLCPACAANQPRYPVKPDHPKWMRWKLRDMSWAEWRSENPKAVEAMRNALKKGGAA